MFVIVGYVVVVAAVLGGYALEGGAFHVLLQPIELLIISGAAFGAFMDNCLSGLGLKTDRRGKLFFDNENRGS